MHSTHRTAWSTSEARSAEPKVAKTGRSLVWQIRKRQSTGHTTQGCVKIPSFEADTKTAKYCVQHAPDEMVKTKSSKCRTESSGKNPSFGVAGTGKGEYCAQHVPDGMVDVFSRKCRTEGCCKQPSFGVAGAKKVEYCAQHASDGMTNVCSKKCRTESCGKIPSFGVAGTKIGE